MEYGLIGQRLAYSSSKDIHALFADYDYQNVVLTREDLPGFFASRDFKGINVTAPYKKDVLPFLDEVDDLVERTGVVNTVINRNGRLIGYNTDYPGMISLIKRCGITLTGKKVLIAGSGGASLTAKAVADFFGAREVWRVSRTGKEGCLTYGQAAAQHEDADIWINTTPCGSYPVPGYAPFDIELYPYLIGVIDCVYNPLRSFIVVEAQERGVRALGGLYMLIAQAKYAAELFTGEKIPETMIEEVYQQLLSARRNLVLIGMPGSGKTTIGKELASRLSMDFVDVDDEIIKKIRMPISDFFAAFGEKKFRDVESEAIAEVSAWQNTVIATGGGAVLRKRNMELLKGNGTIYFIDRPIDYLVTTDDRPLSSNREALQKRFSERYEFYLEESERNLDAEQDIGSNIDRLMRDFNEKEFHMEPAPPKRAEKMVSPET